MANAGKASESCEQDNEHASYAEHEQPSVRSRRARVYSSFKHMVSRLWTEEKPLSIDAEPNRSTTATLSDDDSASATPSDDQTASSDVVVRLMDATAGLLFISETDAPVEVFVWPIGAPFSPEALRTHEHVDAAEPLETESIDHFFRNVTMSRDWHEAAEKEQVQRFGALRDLLKAELADVIVYRFGTTAIDVYVLGRAADGTTVGIRTKVVET